MLLEPIIRDGLLRLGYPVAEVDRRLASRRLDPDPIRSMGLAAAAILKSQIEPEDTSSAAVESVAPSPIGE